MEILNQKRNQPVQKIAPVREKSASQPKQRPAPVPEPQKPVEDSSGNAFQNIIKKLSIPKNLSTYTQPSQESHKNSSRKVPFHETANSIKQAIVERLGSSNSHLGQLRGPDTRKAEKSIEKPVIHIRKKSFAEERKPSVERITTYTKQRKNSGCYNKAGETDYSSQNRARKSVEPTAKVQKDRKPVELNKRSSSSEKVSMPNQPLMFKSYNDGFTIKDEISLWEGGDQTDILEDEIKMLDAKLAAARHRPTEVVASEPYTSRMRRAGSQGKLSSRDGSNIRSKRGSDASINILNSRKSFNFSSKKERKTSVLDDITEPEQRESRVGTETDIPDKKPERAKYNSSSVTRTRGVEDASKKANIVRDVDRDLVQTRLQGLRVTVSVL